MHKERFWATLPIILVTIIWLCQPVWAKSSPPAVEGQLPEFSLPVPKDPEHQNYLGISDQRMFQIPTIDAEVVIIDIFSMY